MAVLEGQAIAGLEGYGPVGPFLWSYGNGLGDGFSFGKDLDQVKGRLEAGHHRAIVLAGIFLALLWKLDECGVVDDHDVGIGDKDRVSDGC